MKKSSNAWGLHDMHGNVWEWTHSVWAYSHDGSEQYYHIKGNEYRAVWGGCWLCFSNFLRALQPPRYKSSSRSSGMLTPCRAASLCGARRVDHWCGLTASV
ncbi:MAG: SUMF1/EgtB/PvdO family nonheme iron enzyme, partial [Pseudomonadota bacterium]